MAFGDDVVLTYEGKDYIIPHNKTIMAMARITLPDEAKGEDGINLAHVIENDFVMATALHRALTFAGAKVDPVKLFQELRAGELMDLVVQFNEFGVKLSPPKDFNGDSEKKAESSEKN